MDFFYILVPVKILLTKKIKLWLLHTQTKEVLCTTAIAKMLL